MKLLNKLNVFGAAFVAVLAATGVAIVLELMGVYITGEPFYWIAGLWPLAFTPIVLIGWLHDKQRRPRRNKRRPSSREMVSMGAAEYTRTDEDDLLDEMCRRMEPIEYCPGHGLESYRLAIDEEVVVMMRRETAEKHGVRQ